MCISFGLIFCTKNEILNTKAACPFSKRRRRVMKKMTRRRITALFMAVLMVVGILPLSMLTGIFSSKAQAKTVTASIDLSKGLKAGTVYGDESIVKVEVLEDMNFKSEAKEVEGVSYTGIVQGTTNPSPNKGAVPTAGAAFKVTAVTDGKITFVTKGTNKEYYFVDSEGKVADENKGTSIPTGSLTFEIAAGKTYFFYASGSKVSVYSISYSYNKASDYKKVSVDCTQGLKADSVYGDKEIADITVLEDMNFKSEAKEVEGVSYTGIVQGTTNPSPNKGAVPTAGAAFKVTAVTDGKITFVTKGTNKE